MSAGVTAQRRWILCSLLLFLPLQFACQTFDTGVRRKIDHIDAEQIDRARVTFDAEAFQVEVRCRESIAKCQEWAARARVHLTDMLKQLESRRSMPAKYPGRMLIQVQLSQYWNPMNLLVLPMLYGVPVDAQRSEVNVDLEYNGQVFHGEGGGACFSSWVILRGPDGSSGCALGEGVSDAVNAALASALDPSKGAP